MASENNPDADVTRRVCILVIDAIGGKVVLGQDANEEWSLPTAAIQAEEATPEVAGRRLAQELQLPAGARELQRQADWTDVSDPLHTDLSQTVVVFTVSSQEPAAGELAPAGGFKALAFHRPDSLPDELTTTSRRLVTEWFAGLPQTASGYRGMRSAPGWRRVRLAYQQAAASGRRFSDQIEVTRAAYLQLLTSVQLVWWLTRTDRYDEFRIWTLEVCADAWQLETVLCQAARGSWLARELIRAKLASRDTDHCDPTGERAGCRYEPCGDQGVSNALTNLADGWRSPLNNPADKLYLVLRPVRKRLRKVLHELARGTLSLSDLDEELQAFPWGEKLEAEGWLAKGTAQLKTKLMHTVIYPSLRTWGVVIGGAPTPPGRRCAAHMASVHERAGKMVDDAADATAEASELMWSFGKMAHRHALDFLREAHGHLGSLLQPPPPPLFTNSREWSSAKLSRDGKHVAFVLTATKARTTALAVGCWWPGQPAPLELVKEAAPLKPGMVVRVGKGACFRNVAEPGQVVHRGHG